MKRHLRSFITPLVTGALLALVCFHVGRAGAGTLADPVAAPGDFLNQLIAAAKTNYWLAAALGTYALLEIVILLAKKYSLSWSVLAWLDQGRVTVVMAGVVGVLTAGLNAYFSTGSAEGALVAALLAIGTYWHGKADEVVLQKLAGKQAGFATFGLMHALMLIGIAVTAGCLSSSQVKTGGIAGGSCVLSDLEKYAGQVEGDLLKLDFTAALDTLKADNNLTQDALNCLVASVVAVLQATMPQPSTGELSPAIVHGKAYLEAHKTASIERSVPWLLAAAPCESPRNRPAVDCRPYSPMKFDGCHWACP